MTGHRAVLLPFCVATQLAPPTMQSDGAGGIIRIVVGTAPEGTARRSPRVLSRIDAA